MTKVATPNFSTGMLAYSRSVEATEAMMFGRKSADPSFKTPLIIDEDAGVRGQTSVAKTDKPGLSNLQYVDKAILPVDCDTLEISFGVTFLNNSRAPSGCDDIETRENYVKLVDQYAALGGFVELATRYLGTIASGRFAWRNRTLTRTATVEVTFGETMVQFDPYAIKLQTVPDLSDIKAAFIGEDDAIVDELLAYITSGLETDDAAPMYVSWFGKLPERTEVYPSQEHVREDVARVQKRESGEGGTSKVLSSVNRIIAGEKVRCGTMHSQKIGNALRCFDDWHDHQDYKGVPVPVDVYAGVPDTRLVLRLGKGGPNSFFNVVRKPQEILKALEDGELIDDLHFFVANLVRGNVLGDKDFSPTAKAAAAKKAANKKAAEAAKEAA